MRPGLERGMKSVPKVGRLLQVLAVALLLGGITAVVVGGFVEGREEAEQEALREEPIKPPLRVTKPERGEPIITLDAAAQRAVGLQVATLPAAKYQDQVRAYGAVLDLTTLTTLNTNYVAAISQLNTAQARLAASQPAFARAQALYAKNIGNLVQVQATEAAVIADRAAVEAAQSQVRTLRATALQEWGPVIGNSMVVDGGLITRLIERDEFLLQITLPPGVRLDDIPNAASVEVAGRDRRAEVRYISPATRADPRIQGLSYFYAAGANSGVLPGMNVRAYLANGSPVDGVIVPPSAVVWWAGRAWVYRRVGDDAFSRREIPTDMPAEQEAGFVVPASLFKPDEPLVTTAAQLLLSEEFRSQIQVGGDD
jgi:hypothetical protein